MSSPNPDLTVSTCRVCLQNNGEHGMSSIFDLDIDLDDIFIYEKIEQCAGIEVLRDKNFPTFICDNCYGLLKVAYEFRITCRRTDEYLKNALLTKKIKAPVEQSSEKNPLSIKEITHNNSRKRTASGNKKCFKVESSPIPEFIKNEIIISSNSSTHLEEPIVDNFDDNDDNVLAFDINYYNDDENKIPSDDNTKVSAEEIKLDIEIEQIPRTKIKTRRKNTTQKAKKSGKKGRSKILTLCKTDNGDEMNKKIARVKKEKNENRKTPQVKKEKEKRPHICEICGNKFPHSYTLKNHIKRHLNEKSFNCEICGYSSHSNMELVRHLRTHTGSKPFKCQYCTRAFGDHSTLIKHERVHRNERPFKCDLCGSSFSYPAVLKRHKLVHTGEKPYRCEICGKCFNDRYHLQSHLKTIQHKNDPRVEDLLQNIKENNV